jgi:hypothetical protein
LQKKKKKKKRKISENLRRQAVSVYSGHLLRPDSTQLGYLLTTMGRKITRKTSLT